MRAIQDRDHIIVGYLLSQSDLIRKASDRIRFRISALEAAVVTTDTKMIAEVLKTDHFLGSLRDALFHVMTDDNNIEFPSLLVAKIMGPLDVEGHYLARRDGVDEPGRAIEQTLMLRRCSLLANAMEFALTAGLLDVCATILPSYLRTVHVYYDRDAEPPQAFLGHLPVSFYNRFTRKECLSMLSRRTPPIATFRLLQHLQNGSPKDVKITSEGQTSEAYKDVLAHFMTYFCGLFRGQWNDREHIDFGTSIPAATLKALIDYLYIGAWEGMRLYNLEL